MSSERKIEPDIIRDTAAQYFISRYITSMLKSAENSKEALLCYQNFPEEKEIMIDFLPAFEDKEGRYGGVTTASTNPENTPRIVVCLSKTGENIFKESLKNEIDVDNREGQSAYKKAAPMLRARREAIKNASEEMKILGGKFEVKDVDVKIEGLNRFTQRLNWTTLGKVYLKAVDEKDSDQKVFGNVTQKQLYATVEKHYKQMIPDEKTGKVEFRMSHIDKILDDLNCDFSLSRKKGFIKKAFGNDFYKSEKDIKWEKLVDVIFNSFEFISKINLPLKMVSLPCLYKIKLLQLIFLAN